MEQLELNFGDKTIEQMQQNYTNALMQACEEMERSIRFLNERGSLTDTVLLELPTPRTTHHV
jgi:hypothetical protein